MVSISPTAHNSETPLKICVYMASRIGARPQYSAAAAEVGTWIGSQGHGLVYGGGQVGLMGVVADAVLAAGGEVTGIITQHLYDQEVAHQTVTELVVVDDMPTRKREMFQRSDAFLVLPGGVGTLEELTEVWCWSSLSLHSKPIGLLNCDGYYDGLLTFLERSIDDGLMGELHRELLEVSDNPIALLTSLASLSSAN